MIGRTLLRQARPTTLGLEVACWMTAIDEALARVRAEDARLPAQLGGPVGTRAGFGDRGAAVAADFARDLGLRDPVGPWHTDRVAFAALAGTLALLGGTLGKIGRDVTLLAQNEIGEVHERAAPGDAGRGGSSSMPHKRNPVAAVATVACAQRVPGLVATLHAAMVQEHERAAGAWHAEWETWSDLLRVTGAAAAWGRDMLERLEPDPRRMAANLASASESAASVGEAAALVRRALAAHDERSTKGAT